MNQTVKLFLMRISPNSQSCWFRINLRRVIYRKNLICGISGLSWIVLYPLFELFFSPADSIDRAIVETQEFAHIVAYIVRISKLFNSWDFQGKSRNHTPEPEASQTRLRRISTPEFSPIMAEMVLMPIFYIFHIHPKLTSLTSPRKP